MLFPAGFFKRPMVVLTVMLFMFGIFVPMALPGSLFDDFNTTGETWIKKGFEFGTNFDTPDIIGSWQSDSDSETFTITGKVRPGAEFSPLSVFKSYRYALYVDGSSLPVQRYPSDSTWITFPGTISFSDDWRNLDSWTTSQKTTGDVRLKVFLEVKIFDIYQTVEYTDTSEIAWDGANVLSGVGAIYFPQSEIDKMPFEAGETANIFVKTGYTGGVGWTVMLRPPADRTDLLSQYPITLATYGDNKETYLGVTVGVDWFKIGSNNQWRVELWNQYFDRNYDEILTIDDRERAPLITDISYVNNDDSFTYTVTVEQTYTTLSYINVDAWYSYDGTTTMPGSGDTESLIFQDLHFPISGGTSTFTVYPKANIQGTIVVKVIAYDIDGRPSSPDYESFVVSNNGTAPLDPPVSQPFVWTTSALIITALLILGMVAILWFLPVKSFYIKFILVVIIGTAGSYFVWLAGTLQLGG